MAPPSSSPAALLIEKEDPAQPDIAALLRNREARSVKFHPAESSLQLPLGALGEPGVRFLVARDMKGKAVAVRGVVLKDGWAEIKGMKAAEDAGGQGAARQAPAGQPAFLRLRRVRCRFSVHARRGAADPPGRRP